MPSSFMASPRRCGLKCPLVHGKTKFRLPSLARGLLMSMVCLITCASSGLHYLWVVPFATWNVNWIINSPGFHFSEEQKDAPLAWQPSHARLTPLQAQPVPTRSAQHRVWGWVVCVCGFGGFVCVWVCAPTPHCFLRHTSSEPSRRGHQDISAIGAKHFWTHISLSSKIKELTVCLRF